MTELLTTAEVASLLKISISTLRSWYRNGHFPSPMPLSGQSLRWEKAVVENWCKAAFDAPEVPDYVGNLSGGSGNQGYNRRIVEKMDNAVQTTIQ